VAPQSGVAEKTAIRGPEGESQIVSLLEVLATEPESRKRDLLAKAMDLLDQTNRCEKKEQRVRAKKQLIVYIYIIFIFIFIIIIIFYYSSNTELMTMIAVAYHTLGEYGTSLQMASHTLTQIPSEDVSTLETVAPKQVNTPSYFLFTYPRFN
jgi:hypothetical protein